MQGASTVAVKSPASADDGVEVRWALHKLEDVHPELGRDLLSGVEIVRHRERRWRGKEELVEVNTSCAPTLERNLKPDVGVGEGKGAREDGGVIACIREERAAITGRARARWS